MRGFEQIYEINYDQTFASVVKSMSFKVLFAIMAHYDLDCAQMEVDTALLNALLKELIYAEYPTGYKMGKLICRLLRALYGLKQPPREWYHTLRDFLLSKGFKSRLPMVWPKPPTNGLNHGLNLFTEEWELRLSPIYCTLLIHRNDSLQNTRPESCFVKDCLQKAKAS